MNKREKIILILTFMVSVYGLIDFFVLPKNNKSTDKGQAIARTNKSIAEFATQSMAEISKFENLIQQNHMKTLISKIESDWEHDPFAKTLDSETFAEQDVSSSVQVPGFVYSGYMRVGDVLFAIINGVEYRPGEIIPENGYKVITITPKKVVLQKNTDRVVIRLKEE
ncbi:hypothetical protein [Desulfobacula phenolica]|uniref:Type IV pilus biogenesis protein PilP n=1 Tax=Desulfobacula phenolica TaxID=90732 RepID=A0A1H2FU83_9BACT|nr:hypothetical protein [Desulfobacula phenolica]SDU10528.1 hypothetical protein SAMN04487931_104327 [Desulfobacula phenolica]